jgi:hypothetical protein
MHRQTTFLAPRTDGRNVRSKSFLLGLVRARCQLDKRVQRHFHPGTALLRYVHEVGVDAAQDGLVGDDQDVFAALKFHDDGFQADDDVAIRLAAEVAVVVLVFITGLEVGWVLLCNILVSETVADSRVELV